MSHECPDCGQWCYCDGEDHDNGPRYPCEHHKTRACREAHDPDEFWDGDNDEPVGFNHPVRNPHGKAEI